MAKDAIRIEHVSKQYRLGAIGGGTLKEDLQSWMAHMRGKQDPNQKIGRELDVSRIGEKFYALEDVSLTIPEGQAIGIIGHNGAGKSTLLKLLARVTAPTSGRIMYNGRITSMLEVGTGFHGELTGRENIYMNGAILGMTKAEIDRKMDQIIEFSEVSKFIDTPVKRYSSGMYVKLAFSVASHLDSEIMIMDEVLAVGDAAFQHKCIQKMRDEATVAGKTVLYVSHNMNTIRQLCDRCAVLDHGHLVFDGDVEKGIKHYVGINHLEMKQHYSLIDNPRPKIQIPAKEASLLSVDLLNTANNTYSEQDSIQMCLEYDSKIETDKMKIMLIFFLQDNTRIAMSESDFFTCKKGTNHVYADIPLDCFVNEEYKVEISLFDYGHGARLRHDCAANAFCFKVHTPEHGALSDAWLPGPWGRMKGKGIKIRQVQ